MAFEGFSDFVASAIYYVESEVIPRIFAGDPFSLALAGIVVLFVLALFFKISQVMYSLVKRFFLFLTVVLSMYFFIVNYYDKLFGPKPDMFLVLIGAFGGFAGIIALVIALRSFKSSAKDFDEIRVPKIKQVKQKTVSQKAKPQPVPEIVVFPKTQGQVEVASASAPFVIPTQIQLPEYLTQQVLTREGLVESLKSDRTLLAVLSYVIIAQFGVFSGITVAAPDVSIGMVFAVAFFIGAFLFIKTSYHNYARGVTHLIIASVFGVVLSILLGHFWATIPLEELLSLNYFKSISLVAFITGIAISLLMGSKN